MSYTNGLDKPSDYFNTKLYTGNGSTQSITGVGFQPDWVWIKERNNAVSHRIFDSVRGATKRIFSNNTDAESTQSNSLTSFDSDGFSLGDSGSVNGSSDTYVAWNWLGANGTASNSDGSITSNVSASTTSGFSIVSYTGTGSNATIGHGLGSAPQVVIIKDRSVARDWIVGDTAIGFDKYLLLNSTTASITASNRFQDTAPSSSVVTIGTHGYVNNSGSNYIAYCFAEKKGFSKFGSYTGNGNDDGTFVYTGFRPAFVIIKNINSARNWIMFDNKRDIDNVVSNRIFPNSSSSQNINTDIMDFLSNGFKLRTSSNLEANESGDTLIYMAFAENPFVTSTGIPSCAR